MSEEKTLAMGTVMGDRYRLISEGSPRDLGMGYKAHDLQADRLVDLVVLDARWGSKQEALERLLLAQQAVTGLSSPGLIPYEHVGLVDGQVYLVYPQAGGQTLAELLSRDTRLDVERAVAIVVRLCEALAPAHHAGLTHGSLSPDSLVLRDTATSEGVSVPEILVLDTGLLPALRTSEPFQQGTWGRVPYISPEQASGHAVHPPSDVYVIGSLFYEMLIGRPPFRAADEAVLALQHLHQEPASLQIMDASIPQQLAQIVYRTLAKEPSARYRNAGQLAHILRAQVGTEPEPVRPTRREHLIVSSPSARTTSGPWMPPTLHDVEGAGAWSQTQQGVDWILLALVVAALIAVLGLIPLWRAVYTRYTSTPAGSSSMQYRWETEPVCILPGDHQPESNSARGLELGEGDVVWYNAVPVRFFPKEMHATSTPARALPECRGELAEFGSPAYGSMARSVVDSVSIAS
jgi:serine/threonine protein kinase